jgi:hypothetical protein
VLTYDEPRVLSVHPLQPDDGPAGRAGELPHARLHAHPNGDGTHLEHTQDATRARSWHEQFCANWQGQALGRPQAARASRARPIGGYGSSRLSSRWGGELASRRLAGVDHERLGARPAITQLNVPSRSDRAGSTPRGNHVTAARARASRSPSAQLESVRRSVDDEEQLVGVLVGCAHTNSPLSLTELQSQ